MVIQAQKYLWKVILICCIVIFTRGCDFYNSEEYDGTLTLKFTLAYDSRTISGVRVVLNSLDYALPSFIDTSDSNGNVTFSDLPWSSYRLIGKRPLPAELDTVPPGDLQLVISRLISVEQLADNVYHDTLELKLSALPGLKINELYTCGPPNDEFYFYDQYLELYNSSSDTVYLDGIQVCRLGDGLANVITIFQFPGEPLIGKDYPLAPHAFAVLAKDAMDHSEIISEAVDLSEADWEFHNSLDYSDPDNPNVPNLDNVENGYYRDFFFNLTCGVIIIADGSDRDYLDGIDSSSVIDGVEYCKNVHEKNLEEFIDRGYTGLGLEQYTGKSVERIQAGYDTNNSSVDFEIISNPTPGYQHEG